MKTHLGFGRIFVKIQWDLDKLWTQLLCYEPCHTTSTSELSCMIVARRQNTTTDRERNIFQLRSVQFFHGGIEGITINMNDGLR